MSDVERTLPRAAGDRLALGITSLFCGTVFGFAAMVVLLTPMPPLGILFTFILVVTEELLLAATAVCMLSLIWIVATPVWVELLFRFAWKKLFLAILLGFVPIVILTVLACFGLKLGAGVGP
jgi:hypothetical protein